MRPEGPTRIRSGPSDLAIISNVLTTTSQSWLLHVGPSGLIVAIRECPIRLSPAARALTIFNSVSWGSASLHPRLYADGRSAGYGGSSRRRLMFVQPEE